jgi:tRNA threonylcarbamoyladenosine biosynthesis protein TsaB
MVLAIKTADMTATLIILDKVEGSIKETNRLEWESGRQLSNDLLKKLEELVGDWAKLKGIIMYKGPGSFTSLRIGITVANTLADSLSIPIVGATGDDWVEQGKERLRKSENDQLVLPEYGGEANITKPKR